MLHRKTPSFTIALFFIVGILLGYYELLKEVTSWKLLVLSGLGVVLSLFLKLKKGARWIRNIVSYVFISSLGIVVCYNHVNTSTDASLAGLYQSAGIWRGTVTGLKDYSKGRKIETRIDHFYNCDTFLVKEGGVLLYLQDQPQLQLGDTITFYGKLVPIIAPRNPYAFDYQQYMLRAGISGQIFLKELISIQERKTFNLKYVIQTFAVKVKERLVTQILNKETFGVINALLLGDKSYLSDEVKERYAASGTMHLLAVSGLHLGIITLLVTKLLHLITQREEWWVQALKTFFLLIIVWSFACLTGFTASVTRAAIMFSFVSVSLIKKNNTNIYNSIFLSAIVLLLIKPLWIFHIGFQLSYSALLGIVFFQPFFSKAVFLPHPVLRKGWDLATVSLAATMSTLPLSLYYFNYTSTVFWLTNSVAVIFAAIILGCGLAYVVTFPFLKVNDFIVQLLSWLVELLNRGMELTNQFSYSMISGLTISPYQIVIYYLGLIGLGGSLRYRNAKWLYIPMLMLVLYTSIDCYENRKLRRLNRITFFSNTEEFAFLYQKGNTSKLFRSEILDRMDRDIERYKAVERLKIDTAYIVSASQLITLEDSVYVLVSRYDVSVDSLITKEVDFLLIQRNSAVPKGIRFKYILADGTNSNWYIRKLSKTYPNLIDIKNNNAFVHEFR